MSPMWRYSRSKKRRNFFGSLPKQCAVFCQRGKIPFAKIGSDYRFLQRDLEVLFLKQEPRKMSREESLRLLDLKLP